MPITWCYQVNANDVSKVYCSTGFPIGCYVDSEGRQKDACVIQVSTSMLYTVQCTVSLLFIIFIGTSLLGSTLVL